MGVIDNPACAARHWALEFNAFGVKARCRMLRVLFLDRGLLGNRGVKLLLQFIMVTTQMVFWLTTTNGRAGMLLPYHA